MHVHFSKDRYITLESQAVEIEHCYAEVNIYSTRPFFVNYYQESLCIHLSILQYIGMLVPLCQLFNDLHLKSCTTLRDLQSPDFISMQLLD